MIRPSQQWAVLIDITNACPLHCSNCTRVLDHARRRFFMSPECFEQAVLAVKAFPSDAEPCVQRSHRNGRRLVGLIGGEPLLHPDFPALVDIMRAHVPVYARGLFTSIDWPNWSHAKWGSAKAQVERLLGPTPTHDGSGPNEKHACGWINWNRHTPDLQNRHQPILVASKDAIPDPKRRAETIEGCWVNAEWSPTVTSKGFFFCEVAGALDMIFDGPGGLPLEPGVWRGDLTWVDGEDGIRTPTGPYAEQINRWCHQCGACLRMEGRADHEDRDDVSVSNLIALESLRSPRIRRGEYVLHDFAEQPFTPTGGAWDPSRYAIGGPMIGYSDRKEGPCGR